ncbi:MAG: Autoinducer 2 sensor kinase/phosphatase LuxQ [Bacteroidetes bacterium ADurb.Bin397]|nr:MAG: Autoinducer 2 sensor kinase/phosphatase LuxQ [Bacteroidetes bacterium ADurb.Bin397]
MQGSNDKIAVNEAINGEEVISHLIETARTLRDADLMQSEEFFEKALNLSKNAQFSTGIGECLLELGNIQYEKGNTRQALAHLHEATALYERLAAPSRACESEQAISDICFRIGNYQEALEAQLKALNFSRHSENAILKGTIYNRLGEIYKALTDYKKAIENHELALRIFSETGNEAMVSITNYYIGNCYNWADDLDKSYEYLDRSLTQADGLNNPELQVKPTGSLAILFTKLKEYDKSLDYFFKAIDYVNITGNSILKADLLKSLGNLYIETGEYTKAISILNESLQIAETLKVKYPKNLIHRFLADAFEKAGDYRNALTHYKNFNSLSGELMNEEVVLKTKGIQLRYDLEETLKEKELAEKTVLLKDQFIANISHEIRTPLNGVLGMANLLADTNPTPEQLEYINTIKLSANNLIVIINDILDYSKIHSGEIRFESSEFRIKELLTGMVQVLKVKAEEKKIKLNLTIDENLPESLIGDAVRLNQILLNLLNNGVKFTDKGSVTLDMQLVESHDLSIKILFKVTDTGIGISSEKIHSIFDSFTQANYDTNRVFGGTGLGLTIVKQLVELQGGSISVNSTLGSGSVFKVELPFKLLKKLEKTTGGKKASNKIPLNDLSAVTILLVEDNKVNQFLAQKLLNKMGFQVEIANNGTEAVASLQEGKFDVILMDVQMPVMNGYELTQVIRTTLPHPVNQIPIIALTAYASNHEKEKALALGMSDYITKPYSPQELLTTILKQVNGKPKVAEAAPAPNESSITAEDIRNSSEKLIQLFSGSTEDVMSLLHMLIGQIPQLLCESEDHIRQQNWPATFQAVHKLKSSVNLLKINILRNLVAELEEFSRDQIHTERIPAVFEDFKKACEITVKLLKDEVIRLKKL